MIYNTNMIYNTTPRDRAAMFFRLKLNWILDTAEVPPVLVGAPTWRHT